MGSNVAWTSGRALSVTARDPRSISQIDVDFVDWRVFAEYPTNQPSIAIRDRVKVIGISSNQTNEAIPRARHASRNLDTSLASAAILCTIFDLILPNVQRRRQCE